MQFVVKMHRFIKFVLIKFEKISLIMNEAVNKFLLAGDKFMPEMHLKQPRFAYSASGPFTENKERILKFKELKKQEIQDIFIKPNFTIPVFSTILLMEILQIYLEKQLLIKYYVTKHLISLEIQNAMNIIQWFKTFSIRGLLLTRGINSDVVSDKKQLTK